MGGDRGSGGEGMKEREVAGKIKSEVVCRVEMKSLGVVSKWGLYFECREMNRDNVINKTHKDKNSI